MEISKLYGSIDHLSAALTIGPLSFEIQVIAVSNICAVFNVLGLQPDEDQRVIEFLGTDWFSILSSSAPELRSIVSMKCHQVTDDLMNTGDFTNCTTSHNQQFYQGEPDVLYDSRRTSEPIRWITPSLQRLPDQETFTKAEISDKKAETHDLPSARLEVSAAVLQRTIKLNQTLQRCLDLVPNFNDLIEAVRSNTPQSTRRMVIALQPVIYDRIKVHGISKNLYDDYAQSVSEALLKEGDVTFKNACSLSNEQVMVYMLKVIKRMFHRALRQKQKFKDGITYEEPENALNEQSFGNFYTTEIDDIIDKKSLLQDLYRDLKEKDIKNGKYEKRLQILEAIIKGFETAEEISEHTGISINTVYTAKASLIKLGEKLLEMRMLKEQPGIDE